MQIRLGYHLEFQLAGVTPFITLLNVHPTRELDLLQPEILRVLPDTPIHYYLDVFGNRCARFTAGPGTLVLQSESVIRDSGELDSEDPQAREMPVEDLPDEVLQFLLASRYCEVDALSPAAVELFGGITPGWGRVQAICAWVHEKVRFGYGLSRPTKTALDVYTERTGVCRDFQHLAITFCRALNIPARYATGYLGDIGVPPAPTPMDFSAWFEAYLEGRWWTFDARHNARRIGRVLMATGRDAADVALTTSFGTAELRHFSVITTEEQTEPMAEMHDEAAAGRI